jgi:peptide/nickel transport system permease protein
MTDADTTTRAFQDADMTLAEKTGRLKSFWDQFGKNRMAVAGMVIFVLFAVVALAGVFLTSGPEPVLDPAAIRLQEKLRPPLSRANADVLRDAQIPAGGIYLLGTDDLGRDVFARMMQGAWVSLTVGFVAVGISIAIGIFLGGIAGYYGQMPIRLNHLGAAALAGTGVVLLFNGNHTAGIVLVLFGLGLLVYSSITERRRTGRHTRESGLVRWVSAPVLTVDTLIMRVVDIMLCFPSFFLILTVIALLPASLYNIMIVIGLTSWMGTTRFVRAEFLSLRELDFVAAAKALGVSDLRIIFFHMMPNAIAPVLVSATIGIASAILTEAGLSFLGFGVPPPHATWGNILSDGQGFIFDAPWLTFVPGIIILIVVLAFNLFGEGLRDTLNPKLRERN